MTGSLPEALARLWNCTWKYGKGLVNLALAESFFEKGGDNYEVAMLANKGRMQAEAGGKIEQCFVGEACLPGFILLPEK